MSERISATQAARNFSDLLNRVQYKQDSFVIVRNGEEVGRLEPVPARGTKKTFRELVEMVQAMGPPDDDFADDLEEIHRNQPPLPEDPWRS